MPDDSQPSWGFNIAQNSFAGVIPQIASTSMKEAVGQRDLGQF